MERIRTVSHHVIKGGGSPIAVEQHPHTVRVWVIQHHLAAVVPGGQLHVEPLDAPGLPVSAQAAVWTFAIDAPVGQADATEITVAHLDLPVMAALRETHGT